MKKKFKLYVGKCLSRGYTSILSDPEGDISIILCHLYYIGYISIAKDKVLLVSLNGVNTFTKEKKEYNRLSSLDFKVVDKKCVESKRGKAYWCGAKYVLLLPAVRINAEFAGIVELLGDYADRGPCPLMSITLLYYLAIKEKESLHDERKLHIHIGNHDTHLAREEDAFYSIKWYRQIINKVIEEKMMTVQCLRKINKKYNYFAHTTLSYEHIIKAIKIIAKCYLIITFQLDDYNDLKFDKNNEECGPFELIDSLEKISRKKEMSWLNCI